MPEKTALPVIILMATRNGSRFLSAQLDSIAAQDYTSWTLRISDDQSTDDTRTIIRDFASRYPPGQVVLLEGPGKGAVANFRSLLNRVDPAGGFFAFCDQDDIWHRDHLSRAIRFLSAAGQSLAIYGCRMQICGADLRPRGLSPLPHRPTGFGNALVQNVLSGNTMVLSPAAAELLHIAEREAGSFPVHDWWAYQLITGAGGIAWLDPHPGILYRQHDSNVIGANRGIRSMRLRLLRYLRGDHARWARQNSQALMTSSARLTPENRKRLQAFRNALDAPLAGKIAGLRQAGVCHQRAGARIGFWLAVLLGHF